MLIYIDEEWELRRFGSMNFDYALLCTVCGSEPNEKHWYKCRIRKNYRRPSNKMFRMLKAFQFLSNL